MVRPFVPVVNSIALRVSGAVPENAACAPDSLLAAGITAVNEAAKSYGSQENIPFSLYVRSRIRGEMLESARERSARRLASGPMPEPAGERNIRCEYKVIA